MTFRLAALVVAMLSAASGVAAQDSLPAGDSVPVLLPPVVVSVRRAEERLERLAGAVTVIDSAVLTGPRPYIGADEVLGVVPGVYVANRYNFSLDQRLSIRGFGARANFGARGVRILLDGIPQTLPDGQSQLTNVDWGSLRRVEILRGPGSLHGNGSGGVIALESGRPEPGARARVQTGSFGLRRWLATASTRSGRGAVSGSAGGFSIDGFRQHSAARSVQLSGRAEYLLSDRSRLAVHAAHADAPEAQNPGALTLAELEARRDSAAANNILRNADKDASQQQLAATFAHRGERIDLEVAAFGLLRSLENPLATATWVSIDRRSGGARAAATWRPLSGGRGPGFTGGFDLQLMRDDRANYRTVAGERTDSVLLDQRERVTERGGFLQASWPVSDVLLLSGGLRRDAVSFRVSDQHFGDGADNSGRRTLAAWSGHGGVSLTVAPATLYATIASAFETPTTTELANAPGATGGFNPDLGPQRTLSFEVGMRGRATGTSWSAAAFLGRISDAIVQSEEVGGRAFFRNAGRLNQDGVELAASRAVLPGLTVEGAYTWARYRFGEYRLQANAATDTLDGLQVPGVPGHLLRLAARGAVFGATAMLEHAIASHLFADDRNTIRVDGWSSTDVAVAWTTRAGGIVLVPSAGVRNLFDRKYVGSVTVNGAFGRVFEPAPGRNLFIGLELRYAPVRAALPDPDPR